MTYTHGEKAILLKTVELYQSFYPTFKDEENNKFKLRSYNEFGYMVEDYLLDDLYNIVHDAKSLSLSFDMNLENAYDIWHYYCDTEHFASFLGYNRNDSSELKKAISIYERDFPELFEKN